MAEGKQIRKDFMPTFDRNGLPYCLRWNEEDVAEWIEYLGFPCYKACFKDNFINGRKLITVDGCSLPRIGITDYKDIVVIAAKIREMLDVEEVLWTRSIELPPREPKTLFIERKSKTGSTSDALTYEQHLRELKIYSEHGIPSQFFQQ